MFIVHFHSINSQHYRVFALGNISFQQATGSKGNTGEQGLIGPKGDTGEKGEKGDPGTGSGSVEINSATITTSTTLVSSTLKDIYFITQTSATTCVISLPEMSSGVFKMITFIKIDDLIYDVQIKSAESSVISVLCSRSTGGVKLTRPTVRVINYEIPTNARTQWMTI